jgi:hypothetical protein
MILFNVRNEFKFIISNKIKDLCQINIQIQTYDNINNNIYNFITQKKIYLINLYIILIIIKIN